MIENAISDLPPEKVFEHPGVLAALKEKLWNYKWTLETLPKGQSLMRSYTDREQVIDVLFKILELAGYFPDPFNKSRSHLHDVSHAIYACDCDVFVTGDERYAKRTRAVYHFLGMRTRVVFVDDFCGLCYESLKDRERAVKTPWIQEAAYFMWVNDHRVHGRDLQHWLAAEREYDKLERRLRDSPFRAAVE